MKARNALLTLGVALVVLFGIRFVPEAYGLYVALKPENMCGVDFGAEALAPDGKFRAVIYQFDCGATTPFTTQVSILKPSEVIPYKSGNVFSAYRGSKEGAWHGPYAEIMWLDNRTLRVAYIGDAIVSKQIEQHGGINILYVKVSAGAANQSFKPTSTPSLRSGAAAA